MAKDKTLYVCRSCGAQSPKWMGKCSVCQSWNTYEEELVKVSSSNTSHLIKPNDPQPRKISEIQTHALPRIILRNGELNRVLGGGLVPGSVILVGGEPGIGKSTLMLQMALQMDTMRFLYVSGEESEQQLKMRAERLGMSDAPCYILNETRTQAIIQHIETLKPQGLIIDSIQTLHTDRVDSSPGSVTQIRETSAELQQYAKSSQVPVFLIGHITKDGSLAGPKVLEHMVDTVLNFEGDRKHGYRMVRSIKNRFGSTNELGIFEMHSSGLKEVPNPSEILLSQSSEDFSGTAVAATLEGNRPLLIEVQALVSSAAYGTPQRSATGYDLRRLNMLLAVLEKRCGFRLAQKDVFLNLAGGIRVDDPAIDLAIVAAVLSSDVDQPLSRLDGFAAEVGLTGEIRSVHRLEQRVSEAKKLGLKRLFISKNHKLNMDTGDLKICPLGSLYDLFQTLFS